MNTANRNTSSWISVRLPADDLTPVDGAALGRRLCGDQPVEERVGHRVHQAESEGRGREAAHVADRGVRGLAFERHIAALVVEPGELTEREQLTQGAAFVAE